MEIFVSERAIEAPLQGEDSSFRHLGIVRKAEVWSFPISGTDHIVVDFTDPQV